MCTAGGRTRRPHAEDAPAPPVVEHELVPDGALGVIETQDGLLALIDELRGAGCFGYDTEFIGEETFYSRFCVVQVSTPSKITLIDALADGIDLLPFWELLAEPSVEKIVHAGAAGPRAGAAADGQAAGERV